MKTRTLVFVGVPIALFAVTRVSTVATRAQRTVEAANRLLASLDADQRKAAVFPMTSEIRNRWAFVPGDYEGIALARLDLGQKRLAHDLLRSALSNAGYHKATTIMWLEQYLRTVAEAAGRKADHRDPGRYWIAVFGTPSVKEPWGWRFQGHHVSLNFSSITGEVSAATPAFLGANPHEIPDGPFAGLRVLAGEEDLARELLGSLEGAQREAAIIAERAPRDVLLVPGRGFASVNPPKGVRAADLSESQRRTLWRLIREYAENLDGDAATAQLDRIRDAGIDEIRFAWAGGTARGEGHYYRIHGPTFVIEYDNVQNGANHSHTVWHDLENDFGGDLLRRHYEQHPHKR